jgi:hypothetical protein
MSTPLTGTENLEVLSSGGRDLKIKKERKIVYFLNIAYKNTHGLLDQLSLIIQITKNYWGR